MEDLYTWGAFLLFYLYFAYALYMICKKQHISYAWVAFIPLAQAFPMLAAAKKPLWWFILLLIPIVNFVMGFVIWIVIATQLGKSKWHGVGVMLPIIQIFSIGMLAFTNGDSIAPPTLTTENSIPTSPPTPSAQHASTPPIAQQNPATQPKPTPPPTEPPQQ